MYIPEFVCGVAATIVVEFVAAIAAAIITSLDNKNGETSAENAEDHDHDNGKN